MRDDRHTHGPDFKTAPHFFERRHRAARRVKPKGGAAGKKDGIDMIHRHFGFEEGGVAQAWRAAKCCNRRDRRTVEHNRGYARCCDFIMGFADFKARDIGDQIFLRDQSVHGAGEWRSARVCASLPIYGSLA